MARGKAKGRVSLRRKLFALGIEGEHRRGIFLAKNLLGYKDYVTNEHSGPDGGPIVIGPAPELEDSPMTNSNSLQSLVGKTDTSSQRLSANCATRSLREFVRQAWHVIEPSTPFVPGWHIDAIIEHLEAVTLGADP